MMRRAIALLMLVAIFILFIAVIIYSAAHMDAVKEHFWWPLERRDKADFSFGICILFASLVVVKMAVVIALAIGYFALVIWLTEFEDGVF